MELYLKVAFQKKIKEDFLGSYDLLSWFYKNVLYRFFWYYPIEQQSDLYFSHLLLAKVTVGKKVTIIHVNVKIYSSYRHMITW